MAYSKQNFQNGQILNAANLEVMENGIIAGQGAYNLLDNSDFSNPVNSQGKTSYTGAGYTIDRWKAGTADCSMYVNAGKSVAFNTKTEGVNAYWRQYLPHSLSQLEGKTFTLAIKDTWGKTHCASGVYPTSAPSDTKSVIWINMYENVSIVLYCATDGTAFVQLTTKKSVPISWVALYEGSYTTDTLPSYVPKGKQIEMLNCNVPLAPHNLLDNSDFRNPVNQRGIKSGTTIEKYTYFLNKWSTGGTAGTITLNSNGLVFNVLIQQKIDPIILRTGTAVTAAARFSDGTLVIVSGVVNLSTSWHWFASPVVDGCQIGLVDGTGDGIPYVRIGNENGKTLVWVALYEGAYDADTLPPYVSKGKHVEMLNCGVPLQPRNLLDNSDFRNPVNQRGATSYSGTIYGIDRWEGRVVYQTVSVRTIDITITATGTSYSGIIQKIGDMSKLAGKTITFAANVWSNVVPNLRIIDANGNTLASVDGTAKTTQTLILTYTVPSDATSDSVIPTILCRTTASGDYIRLYWAALYEGAYDASSLPAYQPKGYAAELVECQRYYKNIRINAIKERDDDNIYSCSFPIHMRATPTVKLIKFSPYGNSDITTFTNCIVSCDANDTFYARLPTCTAHNVGGLFMELSADL